MIITTQQAQVHTAPPGTNRPYRDNPLGVILSCREVRSSSPDIDLQSILGQAFGNPTPPFHNGDRLGDSSVKIGDSVPLKIGGAAAHVFDSDGTGYHGGEA